MCPTLPHLPAAKFSAACSGGQPLPRPRDRTGRGGTGPPGTTPVQFTEGQALLSLAAAALLRFSLCPLLCTRNPGRISRTLGAAGAAAFLAGGTFASLALAGTTSQGG